MNEISQLIGYDIRRIPASYQTARWRTDLRKMFLIRPETPCPLSVDKLVWPSRFRMESIPPGPLSTPDDIVLQPTPRTRYFELFDLWDDLDEMVSEYKPTISGDCGLAIGLLRPENYAHGQSVLQDSWWHAITGCTVRPANQRNEWELLGYDVANSGFTSALSNCGRQPHEQREAEARWGKYLNDFGLFKIASDATYFCEDANKRLSSDGPFYVYELFLIWGALTE